MYGEWVTVDLGGGYDIKVWVNCIPNTSKDELQRRAKEQLFNRIEMMKGLI